MVRQLDTSLRTTRHPSVVNRSVTSKTAAQFASTRTRLHATRAARVARRDEPLAFPRASVVAPRADRRSRARRARTLLHARAGRRDGGAGVLPRCRRRVRGRGAHFHDHAHLLRGWHQGYDRQGHRQREGTRHVGRGGAATNAKRARSADVPPSVFPTSASFRPLSEPRTARDAYAHASPLRN